MSLLERLRRAGAFAWLEGPTRTWLRSPQLTQAVERGHLGGALLPSVEQVGPLHEKQDRARLRALAHSGLSDQEALEVWAAGEARLAADAFLRLYESTGGRQGWVSVAPLATDPDSLQRLWSRVNRPNVLLRLSAYQRPMDTWEAALAAGINVHLTDLFGLDRIADALDRLRRALESRRDRGAALNHVAAALSPVVDSVASRAEEMLQRAAAAHPAEADRCSALRGRTARAIASLIYAQWRAAVEDERFRMLLQSGAQPPLLVWRIPVPRAGAGEVTIVAERTVLAVPAPVLLDPGTDLALDIERDADLAVARGQLNGLQHFQISLADIDDGLKRDALRTAHRQVRAFLRSSARQLETLRRELGPLREDVGRSVQELQDGAAVRRLWQKDPSLWSQAAEAQDEIRTRLGWLDLPSEAPGLVPDLIEFADGVRSEGIHHVVLLGMGGSSLTAEVLGRTLARPEAARLHVLDTTDPEAILATQRQAPMQETLYLAASKSGTTTEVLALLEYFWDEALRRLGRDAGRHFVAATDPVTPLEAVARERGFRRTFSTPPDVGGRYSALSTFGLLPAALMGVDLEGLVHGAARMAHACRPTSEPGLNPGAILGVTLAAAAARGLYQITFLSDPGLEPLEDWIEQLLAESSGKDGRGLLPVIHEPAGPPSSYASQPRLMVYLRCEGDHDSRVQSWVRAGLPVVVIETGEEAEGIGAEFFRWEVATAMACHRMSVNAFDQPDVQRAKDRTVELLKAYHRKGSLPELPVLWEAEGARLVGERGMARLASEASMVEVGRWVVDQVQPGRPLALLLYLTPTPALRRGMVRTRRALRDRRAILLTPGIGPRYLHSTGQLHKGGPPGSTYLIVTCETRRDIEVPRAGHTFGILRMAQALGDLQALQGAGRTAYGLHLDRASRMMDFLRALTVVPPRREAGA